MRSLVLVVAFLALAGCAEQAAKGPEAEVSPSPPPSEAIAPSPVDVTPPPPAGLWAESVHAGRAASPGREVTYLVQVRGLEGRGANVTLFADHARGMAAAPPGEELGAFVTVAVAPDAPPGELSLTLLVERDGATDAPFVARDAAKLRILPASAPTFANGSSALIRYTLRDADTGRALGSNDPALANATFPRDPQFHHLPDALTVVPPNVIPGVYAALFGAQPGESRTERIAPAQGYGEAVVEEVVPRVEVVPLLTHVPNEPREMLRSFFDELIRASGQGEPEQLEGQTFQLTNGTSTWTYRVLELGEHVVRYRAEPREGDRLTLFPAWPDASVVVSANESEIVVRTSPTTHVGEIVTWRPAWHRMSQVVDATDDEVVLRHSPPVGHTYSEGGSRRIASVDEEGIVVHLITGHPLQGRTLLVDVELLEILAS